MFVQVIQGRSSQPEALVEAFDRWKAELSPGATYVIPSDVPHEAIAGPDGCVVIDIFAPVREEWKAIELFKPLEPAEPRWP